MNVLVKSVTLMVLCCAIPGMAAAQQAPAPADKLAPTSAQSEAGEPRADTSSVAPAAPVQPTAPASKGAAPVSTATARAPATAAASSPAPGTGRPAAAAGGKPANSADRLELGTATVTGSQEQPKVMYIVPWKRSDIGDLAGKPMNSLVDEILAPVDRDVFKREVVYYQAVQADASQNGAPPKPSQQGEK
jgi:hypothetical protein